MDGGDCQGGLAGARISVMIPTILRTLHGLLVLSLGFVSQAQTPFTSRLSEAEAVVAQHFRGEPLDVARARSEREIEADEPAWLIVDSGASDTVVPQEWLDAIAAVPSAEPSTLIVVGGQRLRGRGATLPSLTVGSHSLSQVTATAVKPLEAGIDGLLGQSFLKGFVYTVDEWTSAKLVLTRR